MSRYTRIAKLGSASITNVELCKKTRELFDFVIISTGMSTEQEIELAVLNAKPDVIMHTNSTYPCPSEELNLRYIQYLKKKWNDKHIGYSGHETILSTTYAAITLGATWVERHVTIDKNMWGSDQSSSINFEELKEVIKNIKYVEGALQYDPGPRILFEKENSKKRIITTFNLLLYRDFYIRKYSIP